MNVIDQVAAQFRLGEVWGNIGDLNVEYSRSASPERRETLAGRIADLLDEAATLLESSTLARWMSSGSVGTPDVLRARATCWRTFGDPAEET